MEQRKFEVVKEPTETESKADAAGISLLMMGLQALSQRALAGVKDLFTLLSTASAFWLWWSIPDPNFNQIVSLTIYAVFILAANVTVRKMRSG